MPIQRDMTGVRSGRLTAVRCTGKDHSNRFRWECRCDCGQITNVPTSQITHGRVKSCGCLSREIVKARNHKHGHSSRNGLTGEYHSWASARARCHNKGARRYKDYGQRGIEMCQEWRDNFAAFLRDLGPRPRGYTLDRLDVNGNYEPGNVAWIPAPLQARNKRTTVRLTFNGETKALADWAEQIGISANTLHARIKYGWATEKALTTPIMDAEAKAQPRAAGGMFTKSRGQPGMD